MEKNILFRSVDSDPTQDWLNELMSLKIKSSYASNFIFNFNRRKRRSVSALEAAIDGYIASEGDSVSKEVFLENLAYDCNSCNNHRDLLDNCSGTMTDCNGVQTITDDLQLTGDKRPNGGRPGGK